MQTVGPILLGSIFLIVGLLAKALMDWEEIRPEAPRASRGRALFRQLYLAPDLVLLSFGLLIASKGLESVLSGAGIPSGLGAYFATWFWCLIGTFWGALFLIVLLWFAAGRGKYFPIADKTRRVIREDGTNSTITVRRVMWGAGLFKREGWTTLILGNLIGLLCIGGLICFITAAF